MIVNSYRADIIALENAIAECSKLSESLRIEEVDQGKKLLEELKVAEEMRRKQVWKFFMQLFSSEGRIKSETKRKESGNFQAKGRNSETHREASFPSTHSRKESSHESSICTVED